MPTKPNDIRKRIYSAVASGNTELVQRLLTEHPQLQGYSDAATVSWLHVAASNGSVEMIRLLLDLGADINKADDRAQTSPLMAAIRAEHLEAARTLIERGADPNLGRALLSAINIDPEELALEFVKLLVERGADVNRPYKWYGQDNVVYTPLSWAEANEKTAIADYLRVRGAVAQREEQEPGQSAGQSLSQEIVTYFQDHFGPVRPQALIEIVPTEPPIAVHVIGSGENRNHITLFTTGMSFRPMTVPEGGEDYRWAELFIQLPAGWPLDEKALHDPSNAWPIHWLRSIAKYPHQHNTWLGGPVTIIANGDPPEPLAPGLRFTSLLLLAESEIASRDGRKIQLYRLMPLYSEERDFEIAQGIAALLRAFDRSSVPFVVDLNRPPVVGGKTKEQEDQ